MKNNLKEIRAKKKLTQRDVYEQSGLCEVSVRKLESGNNAKLSTVFKVVSVIDCPIEFYDNGQKFIIERVDS